MHMPSPFHRASQPTVRSVVVGCHHHSPNLVPLLGFRRLPPLPAHNQHLNNAPTCLRSFVGLPLTPAR